MAPLRSYLAGVQEIFINTTNTQAVIRRRCAAHACVSRSRFFFPVNCLFCVVAYIGEKLERKNKKITIYVYNLKQQYKIQEIEDGGTNNSLQS